MFKSAKGRKSFTSIYSNSVFSSGTFTFSGELIRNNLNISVDGQGCETNINGLYLSTVEEDQQDKANSIALEYLNEWLKKNSRDDVSLDDALCTGRQIELY